MITTQESSAGTSKADAEKLASLQRVNRAESTLKQHGREISRFQTWCRATGRCPEPAKPRTVAIYVSTEAYRMQSTLPSMASARPSIVSISPRAGLPDRG